MNNNGGTGNEGSSSPTRFTESPPPRISVTELALFTPPRVPGHSADSIGTPLVQYWPPAGPSGGASGSGGMEFAGGLGFQGGQAVPVGGSGGEGVAGAPRVGGSPMGRKRGRDGGAGGSEGDGEGGRDYHYCSVCNKAFSSPRAVFGHMRKHPDRGWTGAHPPPAFRAEEEEFVDLRPAMSADAEAVTEERRGGDEPNYRVPDLNSSPPPHSN